MNPARTRLSRIRPKTTAATMGNFTQGGRGWWRSGSSSGASSGAVAAAATERRTQAIQKAASPAGNDRLEEGAGRAISRGRHDDRRDDRHAGVLVEAGRPRRRASRRTTAATLVASTGRAHGQGGQGERDGQGEDERLPRRWSEVGEGRGLGADHDQEDDVPGPERDQRPRRSSPSAAAGRTRAFRRSPRRRGAGSWAEGRGADRCSGPWSGRGARSGRRGRSRGRSGRRGGR